MGAVRRGRGEDGATTVEFALLLMLLAIGAFFGWYFYVQSQLDRAAGIAARHAAVPTVAGAYSFCTADTVTNVNAHLVTEQVVAAEVTLADSRGTLAPGAACTSVPVKYVHVTLSHTFRNPFSSLVALLTPLSGTVTVTGDGQADVETK